MGCEIVVKGIVIHSRRALILKRTLEDEIDAGTWEPVGGKIEFGESLEFALMREAKEETGLAIKVDSLLFASTFMVSSEKQVVLLTYLCFAEDDNVILSNEHTDYLWVTKSEMKKHLPKKIIKDYEKYNVFMLEEIM